MELQKKFYERYAVEWLSSNRHDREKEACIYKVRNFFPLLKGVHPKSVLDFGCGTGDTLNLIAKQLNTDDVIGVDLSSTIIEHAKSIYPNFNFVQGSVEVLKGYKVDLILFFDVLEHMENIPAILNVCKDSAKYIGIKIPLEKTWIINFLNNFHLRKPQSRLFESDGHLYEFSRKDFENILRNANLQIIKSITDFEPEFNPYMLNRMKSKIGFIARLKYFIYVAFSKMPIDVSRPLMRAVSGENYFVLCKC